MPLLTPPHPTFLANIANTGAAWHWPAYTAAWGRHPTAVPLLPSGHSRRTFRRLLAASYIEWRYYAILTETFHGIVGLALINPQGCFARVAESGLLLIITGLLDCPRTAAAVCAQTEAERQSFC